MKTKERAREFIRDDGEVVRVVAGFRDQVLSAPRVSVQPKPEWNDDDYRAAADKKIRHAEAFVEEYQAFGGVVEGARMLELGCGAGIDCMLMSITPVSGVIGIDMELPLYDEGDKGERTRRLMREVLGQLGRPTDIASVLGGLQVGFAKMDARRMSFPDDSFDLVWSRAAMEHVVPPQGALQEMGRVVRRGGLMYHSIDPYYWLKGCHKGGVTDIPWGHARLTAEEYYRSVAEEKGPEKAEKCSLHLQTLNQFTPREWRRVIEAGPFEILEWTEEVSPLAERLLDEHPDVRQTALGGVERDDLTCSQIKVWMRNR